MGGLVLEFGEVVGRGGSGVPLQVPPKDSYPAPQQEKFPSALIQDVAIQWSGPETESRVVESPEAHSSISNRNKNKWISGLKGMSEKEEQRNCLRNENGLCYRKWI